MGDCCYSCRPRATGLYISAHLHLPASEGLSSAPIDADSSRSHQVKSTVSASDDDPDVYKLVVVGGGPAGIGVFVRAARLGLLPRLLDPEAHGKPQDLERVRALGKTLKGVAVLHDGDATSFGSGNLGAYIINSNTFANSLTSSVLDDKPDLDPPERTQGTFLERARQHASAQRLDQIGAAPACLVDIGKFLQHVGACVLEEFDALASASSKCFLQTKGTRLDVLANGLIRVEATNSQGETFTLLTKHVALATGGEQEKPVLEPPALRSKLFMSDECVRDEGFARLRSLLLQSQTAGTDKAMKVCVVGGSHSAFSVAWLLLNKFRRAASASASSSAITSAVGAAPSVGSSASPSKAQLSTPEPPSDKTTSPSEHDERIASDTAAADPLAKKEDTEKVVPSVTPILTAAAPPTSTPVTSPSKSESVRKPTAATAPTTSSFKPKDITILHRTPIRCYYGSRKDAEADGADGSRVDRGGCVNTFTGLREDAKALFRDVRAGKETRVRLFQINRQGSQALAAKAYESASAIVWCCEYKTRMPLAFDSAGNSVSFLSDNGVLKLDNKGRLQLAASSGPSSLAKAAAPTSPTQLTTAVPVQQTVTRILGLGLGFHLRAPVDEMGAETRADGVTVYHRRGASLVLEALFGPEVYGSSSSFEEMVEKVGRTRRFRRANDAMLTMHAVIMRFGCTE